MSVPELARAVNLFKRMDGTDSGAITYQNLADVLANEFPRENIYKVGAATVVIRYGSQTSVCSP